MWSWPARAPCWWQSPAAPGGSPGAWPGSQGCWGWWPSAGAGACAHGPGGYAAVQSNHTITNMQLYKTIPTVLSANQPYHRWQYAAVQNHTNNIECKPTIPSLTICSCTKPYQPYHHWQYVVVQNHHTITDNIEYKPTKPSLTICSHTEQPYYFWQHEVQTNHTSLYNMQLHRTIPSLTI